MRFGLQEEDRVINDWNFGLVSFMNCPIFGNFVSEKIMTLQSNDEVTSQGNDTDDAASAAAAEVHSVTTIVEEESEKNEMEETAAEAVDPPNNVDEASATTPESVAE